MEIKLLGKFQFTHPGGVRLYQVYSRYLRYCFNSRTREGCDYGQRQGLDA